jgi:energy-converting hydrogenase B subunit D
MSEAVVLITLLLVGGMATAVVLTRDPARQAIVLSGYGITLGVLCVVLQAPDVALSQVAVGTVILPLIVTLAIHAIAHRKDRPADRQERRERSYARRGGDRT